MPYSVFLDTEFTNFEDPQLISLGMAATCGEEFYAEVAYSLERCSLFVRQNVIPLLHGRPGEMPTIQTLAVDVAKWLETIRCGEELQIYFDYRTDWDLFVYIFSGSVPLWCKPKLYSSRNINQLRRYAFYKKHSVPEHHALYDAMAARYAFRER